MIKIVHKRNLANSVSNHAESIIEGARALQSGNDCIRNVVSKKSSTTGVFTRKGSNAIASQLDNPVIGEDSQKMTPIADISPRAATAATTNTFQHQLKVRPTTQQSLWVKP